jgi:hypothetical protein
MTDKEKAAAKSEEAKKSLEVRLTLLHKEAVTDKDGKVTGEKHVQATDFEITDQDLCEEISDLLRDALTKEHMETVPKHKETNEPLLDAHKFQIPLPKVEKADKADKKKTA